MQIVTDLCSTVQRATNPCLGFCLDNTGQLRGTYDPQRQTVHAHNTMNLEDLLKNQVASFVLAEKYALSVTLISSLLQLSQTPWLSASWNKSDIVFLRANSELTSSKTPVDVKHPYLTREHKKHGNSSPRIKAKIESDSFKFLALAVMLIEIWGGRPIEDLYLPQDLGPNSEVNEATKVLTVRRWLDGPGRELGHWAVLNAISFCAKGFMEPSASLKDEKFARTVQEQVLDHLEQEMNYLLFGPFGHSMRRDGPW
jgi:hypothetical protein